MHPAEPGDTYLDDAISYRLTVEYGALVTDRFHLRADGDPVPVEHPALLDQSAPRRVDTARASTAVALAPVRLGVWWWRDEVPEGIEPEIMAHHR